MVQEMTSLEVFVQQLVTKIVPEPWGALRVVAGVP